MKKILIALLALTALTGAQPQSVKPGINESFKGSVDVQEWVQRWEGESREIYVQRQEIALALGLKEGQRVADVGTGTGLFLPYLARAVGASGWVYAVDITPTFLAHVSEQARRSKLERLTPVLCSESSVCLPPESVDLIFVCDTYHHFEYPSATLATIRTALRPGGQLVVVDFIREEGVSRPWVLDHVRLGLSGVRQEVEKAGFEFAGQTPIPGLAENYLIRFRRP